MRGEIRDGHLVWVDNGMAYDVPDDDIRLAKAREEERNAIHGIALRRVD